MACNVYIASWTFVVEARFAESTRMRVSARGVSIPSPRVYAVPGTHPTGDVHPRVGTRTGVFAEGSVVWGTRDRGWGALAEGDRQNCSQAPNAAVEISHDLPNSTFYIL